VDLLLSRNAALQVADAEALTQAITNLLASPSTRDRLGEAGRAALYVHEGATEKTVRLLLASQP